MIRVRWPAVALVLGLGTILVLAIFLFDNPGTSTTTPIVKPVEVDYYRTGVIEVENIQHFSKQNGWGLVSMEILTVKDFDTHQLFLLYLCPEIPTVTPGMKLIVEYKKDYQVETGCHVLQKMTVM